MWDKYVNFEEGLDIIESKPGAISGTWFADHKLVAKDDHEKFKAILEQQTWLFSVLRKIIQKEYTASKNRQYDMNSPNVDKAMMYYAGYLKGLETIHKIIPRPKEK